MPLGHRTVSQKHFRLDLTGIRLEANDLDWAFGDGEPVHGAAHHLLMVLMSHKLLTDTLTGRATARFTTG